MSTPGPGNYQTSKKFGQEAQSATIRGRKEERHETLSPGPGAYDSSYAQVKDKVVTYKMGNTSRTEVVSKEHKTLPGPGNYDQESGIGKGPKYTMGKKSPERNDSYSPGPGSYDAQDTVLRAKSPSYAMSKTNRTDIVSKSL